MVQIGDRSEPPRLSPSVPDTFESAIGRLIVFWGMMEQQFNILLWAVLKRNMTHEEGWKHLSFDKRYDLFQSEWVKLAKGHPALAGFPKETCQKIRTWKVLRDSISHKEIIGGLMLDGNHSIQFYNKTRTKQHSKPYYIADFDNAAMAASDAAGWFYWICQANAIWPLPSPDTLLLRSLPNTDHLRIPT